MEDNSEVINEHTEDPEAKIRDLRAISIELIEALRECVEYFSDRADAEYTPDSASSHPNEEMKILTTLNDLIRKAGAGCTARTT